MLGKFARPPNVLTLTMSHGNSGDEIRSNNVNEMKDLKRWTSFRNIISISLDSAQSCKGEKKKVKAHTT